MAVTKLEKLNQSIKKALGELVHQLLPEHPNIIINDVLLDPSLRTGRVWVSASQTELDQLETKRVALQNQLATKIKTRYTPKLTFLVDDRYLDQLDQLFNQLDQPPSK